MSDILDSVLYLPAPGVRLSEDAQARAVEFLRAVKFERDLDDIAGVVAGLALILMNRMHGAEYHSVMRRINEIARKVEREWSGYL